MLNCYKDFLIHMNLHVIHDLYMVIKFYYFTLKGAPLKYQMVFDGRDIP